MRKVNGFRKGRIGPTPTSEELPRTSSRQRGETNPPSSIPPELNERAPNSGMAQGQRPRGTKKMITHGLDEPRHSIALRMGFSKSRKAEAEAEAEAALNRESLSKRSSHISSLRRTDSGTASPHRNDETSPGSSRREPFTPPHEHLPPIVKEPPSSSSGPVATHTAVVPPATLTLQLSYSSSSSWGSQDGVSPRHTTTPITPQKSPVRQPFPTTTLANQGPLFPPPLRHPEIESPRREEPHRDAALIIATQDPVVFDIVTPAGPLVPQTPPHANTMEARPVLPSRRDALVATARGIGHTATQAARQTVQRMGDTATQVARQAHLPQAGRALVNTTITREIGATLNSTLVAPLRLGVQTASTLFHTGAIWWSKERQSAADLQLAVAGAGVDLGLPEAQAHAHRQAVTYGGYAATALDTFLPVLHSTLKLAVVGTSMAFGLGRNTGMAAGDALGRVDRGASQAPGLWAGPEPAAAALSSDRAVKLAGAGAMQWLLGSITGGVGNFAGQYFVAPLVNLIPRQFVRIDHRAVLPDRAVFLMNQLQPGAGDALRTQVQQAQRNVDAINSPDNVLLGQIAFDMFTAGRFAVQGGALQGATGQVLTGLAVSAGAGMAIGVVMGTRQSVAQQQIPNLDALEQAAQAHTADPDSDGAAALAQVPRAAVPLFFPKRAIAAPASHQVHPVDLEFGLAVQPATTAQRSRLGAIRDNATWAMRQVVVQPLATVGQAWAQSVRKSPLIEPAAAGTEGFTAERVLHTASNVAGSIINRGREMAKATTRTSFISTGGAMLASAIDGPMRRLTLMASAAVGIHEAIQPWFDTLAHQVGPHDQEIHDLREKAK